MRLIMKLDELSNYINTQIQDMTRLLDSKQACVLAFYHFAGYVCILIAWGSMQCHNSYQTVIIMWLHLVHKHDTQSKLNFTQMALQMQFINKCSFYITLSVDLLFLIVYL